MKKYVKVLRVTTRFIASDHQIYKITNENKCIFGRKARFFRWSPNCRKFLEFLEV